MAKQIEPHESLTSGRRLSASERKGNLRSSGSRGPASRGKQTLEKYIPSKIEAKWQKAWEDARLYASDLSKPNKYYVLAEFAYPSGDLHMGHWFTFVGADVFARFKRMQGYQVFFPNGFDAFGLPAENAAIQRGVHPKDWTKQNIAKMKKQYRTMGASFSFDHQVITSEPAYYKWNQWIFLKMFEEGLVYRGRSLANWCPNCQTVLANEGVVEGKCWRCGTEVLLKEVSQWFFKITEYADRLLWKEVSNVPKVPKVPEGEKTTPFDTFDTSKPFDTFQLDWPKSVRDAQNQWIGKSEGMEIDFPLVTASEAKQSQQLSAANLEIASSQARRNDRDKIRVYTVFPETIFGVTYMVLAPEHGIVASLLSSELRAESSDLEKIRQYVTEAKKKNELQRTALEREKTGVFTGLYCINPANNQSVPIWVADYVIGTYGTGAVMGVPGSDQRDFEFAKKYKLPIVRVIGAKPDDHSEVESAKDVLEEGYLVNSGEFSGMKTPNPGKEKIKDWLEAKGFGKRKVQYHLHDWSISRQRYWGTPIPVVYCVNCWKKLRAQSSELRAENSELRTEGKDYVVIDGKEHAIVPVQYEQLPVELPYEVDYTPKGKPPLASNQSWLAVKCPVCQGKAFRDTETMDTFVDSSWYFFRYLSPYHDRLPFDPRVEKRIMPVEIYFGGAEHTLGHTLYSRFFTKFFKDIGLTEFEEYALRRINHGIILGQDGAKMSKSKGNVVNPDEEVKRYGADTIRVYLAFFIPYEATGPWVSERVFGAYRFLQRLFGLFGRVESTSMSSSDVAAMHRAIQRVTEDIETISFNTAVAALMEWLNYLSRKENVALEEYKTLLLLLAPFAPHLAEELWQKTARGPATPFPPAYAKASAGKPASDKALPAPFNGIVSPSSPVTPRFKSIHIQQWPQYDPKHLVSYEATVVVQVNGKVRDTISVQSSELRAEKKVEDLARQSKKVQKYLQGKQVRKVVYVEGKIINFVVE